MHVLQHRLVLRLELIQRERDTELVKLDGEKKKLENDKSKHKADLKRATKESVIETEAVEEDAAS